MIIEKLFFYIFVSTVIYCCYLMIWGHICGTRILNKTNAIRKAFSNHRLNFFIIQNGDDSPVSMQFTTVYGARVGLGTIKFWRLVKQQKFDEIEKLSIKIHNKYLEKEKRRTEL